MNVLLAKEDGDKIGIISLLNQPIGERDVGTLALPVGILVAVDFLWEMSTDIVEHVRGRNQTRSSNVALLPLQGYSLRPHNAVAPFELTLPFLMQHRL